MYIYLINMNNKKILLKKVHINDFYLIEEIYNSHLRNSIDKKSLDLNQYQIKKFLNKYSNDLLTIICDNQRIGLILNQANNYNVLLRYNYILNFSQEKIKKALNKYNSNK